MVGKAERRVRRMKAQMDKRRKDQQKALRVEADVLSKHREIIWLPAWLLKGAQ